MRYLLWLLFLIFLLLPATTYLVYYYRRLGTRRNQLLQTLQSLCLEKQYMLMRHGQRHDQWAQCKDPGKEFETSYFNEDFKAGNSHQDYLWPVLLFTILCGVGWLVIWQRVFPSLMGLGDLGNSIPAGFAFGFIGAYFACILTIFDGSRHYALEPSLYQSVSFRIMFSSFAAYVVSQTVLSAFVPIVSLAIGMFPLEGTWSFITERAAQIVGPAKAESEVGAELAKIQGLEDKRNREQLLDAGISTVQGLATSDPFVLFFETAFALRTVVDLMDKAILYLYIGDTVVELRKHGINGIIELVALAKLAEKKPAFESRDSESNEPLNPLNPLFAGINVDKVIGTIGKVLGQEPDELKAFIYNMDSDPMVTLVYNIWGRYYEAASKVILSERGAKPLAA